MKKGQKKKKYSPEFKIGVILDMHSHRLGYRETVRKHWEDSKGKEPNHIKQVQRWERIYLEEGAEGLMKEKRKRACFVNGVRKGRPPKFDKSVEGDLIRENQWLRMENEYLKKLRALVLAEEQEQKKNKKQ
jgi:hypothetical protein